VDEGWPHDDRTLRRQVKERPLVIVLSPTGNHQDRGNNHHRDKNEYDGAHQNLIQHLIKHDDHLPRFDKRGPVVALKSGSPNGDCERDSFTCWCGLGAPSRKTAGLTGVVIGWSGENDRSIGVLDRAGPDPGW
jgi:hypothetical protein